MRPRQAGRQEDDRAMPARICNPGRQRPVGRLGGSAGDDGGKQGNRKAQHRLLRMMVLAPSSIAPPAGCGTSPRAAICKYG
jgi:hypothetical protein